MDEEMSATDSFIVKRYYRSRRTTDSMLSRLDALLVPFSGFPKLASPKSLGSPKKLLLADGGHLGDTIIIASLLPALREAFPHMKIGILTGSWNRELLESNVQFDRIHLLDHWYMNRSTGSRVTFIYDYAGKSRRIVRELKATGYDVAINMRPWFPNFVPVLWRANVPVRLGFNRSGFIPLLTHFIPFEYDRRPYRSYHVALLSTLPIDGSKLERLITPYIRTNDGARDRFRDILGFDSSQHFAVLHVGGSTPKKDWQNQGWIEIAKKLRLQGLIPVFTGAGLEQEKSIAQITAAVNGSINACGKLSWTELVTLIGQARLVLCVDTSIGHVAAALGTPCTSLLNGMQDYKLWRPVGQRSSYVTHEISCNPCFNTQGCEHMSCVREITVSQVERSIGDVLRTPQDTEYQS